jgi:hypothetical protein
MCVLDSEAKTIIEEIRIAFQDVPQGPLSLHQAIANTWAGEDQVAAARALDLDRHWQEIPDQHIQDGAKALYGADPQSWRYFIPAFMIWALRNFKVSDAFLADQTISSLYPSRPKPAFSTSRDERFETLSLAQKHAVRRFLAYVSDNEQYVDAASARKALDDWCQYCPA